MQGLPFLSLSSHNISETFIIPGSHGSLTKAGKVRNITPKVPRTGINSRSKKIPRVRNRKLYVKRVVLNKYGGQANSIAAQKHARATQKRR